MNNSLGQQLSIMWADSQMIPPLTLDTEPSCPMVTAPVPPSCPRRLPAMSPQPRLPSCYLTPREPSPRYTSHFRYQLQNRLTSSHTPPREIPSFFCDQLKLSRCRAETDSEWPSYIIIDPEVDLIILVSLFIYIIIIII